MRFFLDVHIAPRLALWLRERGQHASTFEELGWDRAPDEFIFRSLAVSEAVIISKDADFATLTESHGPPPQLLWLRCGNSSASALVALFEEQFQRACSLLEHGQPIVEMS